jgi:uncharacterized protein YdhG (YjbR/CyaY superfamily)
VTFSKKDPKGRGRTTVAPTEGGKSRPTRGPAADVDAYVASQPKAVQPYLRHLRAAIKEAAPKAQERISYGIAGYFYGGRLIYFGGAARHVALYPAGDAKGLEQFLYGASTLRFPLDQPLPIARIKALVRARVKEKDAAGKAKPGGAGARHAASTRSRS